LAGVAAAAIAVALSGCSSSSTTTSTSSAPTTITVTAAHVNEPTMPDTTGAFAVVTNTGATAVSLTGVSVPADVAESAGLHETVMKDGAMAMQPVSSIPVPAGGTVELKPGGFHIMLMKPKVTLGQMVAMTLTFSDGTSVSAAAPVTAPSASPSSSMSSGM
jgi:copper(I)-binding protein